MSMIEEEFFLEDADVIEDLTEEIIDELAAEQGAQEVTIGADEEEAVGGGTNVISTVTMAELYASQGFLKRALTIYREMLETDPDNAAWKKRLYELKRAIDEDIAIGRGETEVTHAAAVGLIDISAEDAGRALPPAQGGSDIDSDRVLAVLEKWLDSIKRRQ